MYNDRVHNINVRETYNIVKILFDSLLNIIPTHYLTNFLLNMVHFTI